MGWNQPVRASGDVHHHDRDSPGRARDHRVLGVEAGRTRTGRPSGACRRRCGRRRAGGSALRPHEALDGREGSRGAHDRRGCGGGCNERPTARQGCKGSTEQAPSRPWPLLVRRTVSCYRPRICWPCRRTPRRTALPTPSWPTPRPVSRRRSKASLSWPRSLAGSPDLR